ncbi:unannotated protein [freshwater metagenome]|uniref:Unannotated protein n=2 Tax=freshwater metagenome TaxID=449393 RepID=A0A6J6LY70_9ZZZZ
MFGISLSALGNGMVLPFSFVYLHSIRHMPISVAGLVFSYGALISLIAAPAVGTLTDKWGPKIVLIFSLVISALGYAGLAFVTNAPQAFMVMTICAIGQSAMWPSQSALNAELTPVHLRERIFGSQFAIMNLGLGIGGMVSSLVVSLDKPLTFQVLFIGDGISYLVYLAVILTLGKVGGRSKERREANAKLDGGWSDVIQDKVFRKVWLVALFAIFLSYSQLEVGYASFATGVAGVRPSQLAWGYGINTGMIAIFQLAVTKRLQKLSRAKALAAATLFWASAWVFLAIGGFAKSYAVLAMLLCQFVFAIGEMIWSPVLPALVNELAPDHLRGRYNSASTNAWQVGMILGPACAGSLLGAGLWVLWVALLFVGLLAVCFFALRLKLPVRPATQSA